MARFVEGYHESYINADNQKKRIIFANSLAKAYKIVRNLDSLATYVEEKVIEILSLGI